MRAIRIVIRTLGAASLTIAAMVGILYGQESAAENAIRDAEAFLQRKQWSETLRAAEEAVRLDSNNWRAHYYVALAYFKMQSPMQAESAIDRAMRLVPTGKRESVSSLKKALQDQIVFLDKVKLADAAMEDGLRSKAVWIYVKAYWGFQSRTDIGLKAAQLLADNDEWLACAKVIQAVKRNSPEPEILAQANDLLGKGALQLKAIRDEESEKGWEALDKCQTGRLSQDEVEKELIKALESFQSAVAAFPQVVRGSGSDYDGPSSPYIGLATISAAGLMEDKTIETLKEGSKMGLLPKGPNYFGSKAWERIMKSDKFLRFLEDAFGSDVAKTAPQQCHEPWIRNPQSVEQAARKRAVEKKREAEESHLAEEQRRQEELKKQEEADLKKQEKEKRDQLEAKRNRDIADVKRQIRSSAQQLDDIKSSLKDAEERYETARENVKHYRDLPSLQDDYEMWCKKKDKCDSEITFLKRRLESRESVLETLNKELERLQK
jgi:hypothetical protein